MTKSAILIGTIKIGVSVQNPIGTKKIDMGAWRSSHARVKDTRTRSLTATIFYLFISCFKALKRIHRAAGILHKKVPDVAPIFCAKQRNEIFSKPLDFSPRVWYNIIKEKGWRRQEPRQPHPEPHNRDSPEILGKVAIHNDIGTTE